MLVFTIAAGPPPPTSLSDNFRDGNLTGWWFDHPDASPTRRVENGVLHSAVGDHKSLVDQMVFSNQAIQTSAYLNPDLFGAFGGVTPWYQDAANYVSVVVCPVEGRLMLTLYEVIDGVASIGHYENRTWIGQWYRLRVKADSVTGAIAMYVDGV